MFFYLAFVSGMRMSFFSLLLISKNYHFILFRVFFAGVVLFSSVNIFTAWAMYQKMGHFHGWAGHRDWELRSENWRTTKRERHPDRQRTRRPVDPGTILTDMGWRRGGKRGFLMGDSGIGSRSLSWFSLIPKVYPLIAHYLPSVHFSHCPAFILNIALPPS